MSVHVPAWKRIGLKLKHVNEVPDQVVQPAAVSASTTSTPSKRESSTPTSQDRPSKRQRVDESSQPLVNGNKDAKPLVNGHAQSNKVQNDVNGEVTSKRKRKKSVSFSAETKPEDGDTRTTIDFPAGSPGQTPRKQQSSIEVESSPIPAKDNTESISKSVKKVAKEKKKKPKNIGTSDSSKNIEYLNQHCNDRSTWKFNKNRDIWILNHALGTESIAAKHNSALAGYINGLPEEAASRARLIQQCREALPEAEQPILDQQQREWRDNLPETLSEHNVTDTLSEWMLETPRPYLLLWAMGEKTNEHAGSTPRPTKKKSRTAAPVDLSSSSESDSESSSDSSLSSSSSEEETSSSGSDSDSDAETTSSSE